jgi:hypothetical protein
LEPVEFEGYAWAKLGLKPGPHILRIEIEGLPPQLIEKVLEIKPSETTEITVRIEV